jgi:hypothetical protein
VRREDRSPEGADVRAAACVSTGRCAPGGACLCRCFAAFCRVASPFRLLLARLVRLVRVFHRHVDLATQAAVSLRRSVQSTIQALKRDPSPAIRVWHVAIRSLSHLIFALVGNSRKKISDAVDTESMLAPR